MPRKHLFLLFRGVFLLPIISIFIGCDSKPKEETTGEFIERMERERKADSMTKKSLEETYHSVWTKDTVGMSVAPVRVLSAKLVKGEYSNYRDIHLVYKNFSSKRVSAIRFKWYGTNAFGEPADMGGAGSIPGLGGGFTDEPLSAGRSSSGEWGILSRDGRKVVAAWAYEVVFEDGTKWKSDPR